MHLVAGLVVLAWCAHAALIIDVPSNVTEDGLLRSLIDKQLSFTASNDTEVPSESRQSKEYRGDPENWCGSWSCKTNRRSPTTYDLGIKRSKKPTKLKNKFESLKKMPFNVKIVFEESKPCDSNKVDDHDDHDDSEEDFDDDYINDVSSLARYASYLTPGLSTTLDTTKADYWNYKDTTKWNTMWPACAGMRQSPIDLVKTSASTTSGSCLKWENYHSHHKYLWLDNSGHTIDATTTFAFGGIPTLSGGILSSTYKFYRIHWHWGSDSTQGSEHTINGQMLPLELHAIHYNSKFASAGAAIASGESEALAVVGVLFKESLVANHGMKKLTKAMVRARMEGTQAASLPLAHLGLKFKSKYYTYLGSLTTPGCAEIVRWIVREDPLKITYKQLEVFRNILVNGAPMVNNYRKPQPLNGRVVQFYNSC